jgi:hypothetical protein
MPVPDEFRHNIHKLCHLVRNVCASSFQRYLSSYFLAGPHQILDGVSGFIMGHGPGESFSGVANKSKGSYKNTLQFFFD